MPPKAVPLTSDDNLKLCLAVIKHLGGTPDWKIVAADCGIVSPAAASKRYSRLLASVGQTKTKNEPKDPSASASGNDTDSGGAEKEEPKKRKAAGGAAGGKGGAKGKPAKKVKVEVSPEDEASDGKEGIVRLGAVNPKDIMVEAVKTNDDDGDEA